MALYALYVCLHWYNQDIFCTDHEQDGKYEGILEASLAWLSNANFHVFWSQSPWAPKKDRSVPSRVSGGRTANHGSWGLDGHHRRGRERDEEPSGKTSGTGMSGWWTQELSWLVVFLEHVHSD